VGENGSKCILLLSTKSSGSSALQNLLCASGRVRHVSWTRHNEHETLYWVKAASILGLPQKNMADSEVPIGPSRARAELVRFLTRNLGEAYAPPGDDREMVFEGWRALCRSRAPVFLEKTPHHLHQSSALDLILETRTTVPDVALHVVGLVRNPMDVLYSMWDRRRETPEVHQHEWREAYGNLQKLKERLGDDLTVVRYEDMIDDPSVLEPVCRFAGIPVPERGYFHGRSLQKWSRDPRYGFVLDPDVERLARDFGYSDDELRNETRPGWPVYRCLVKWPYRAVRPGRLLVRAMRKRARERGGRPE